MFLTGFIAQLLVASKISTVYKTSCSLQMKNKIDGVVIDGDLKPMSNNILVKVKEAISSTVGGIYIPDTAKERPTEGKVIAVGGGRVHPETAYVLDMAVNVGDNVIYGKYDGSELKYNDINHQLIKDDDVLLKYTGDEALLSNVECVKDQVMIKLPPKEESNSAGLIVSTPGSKDKRADYGIVTKVGPGRQAGNGKVMEIQVKPGDNVRFRDFAGTEVKIEGKEYLVIRAYDILAKW
jgi:chaperonin GroES